MPHKKKTKTPPSTSISRQLKQRGYKRFKLEKRIRHPAATLPPAWTVFRKSLSHIWAHKKLFGGITLVYLLLTVVLVRGYLLTNDLSAAKEAIQELVSGASGQLAGSLTVLGILVGTSTANGQAAGVYQAVIIVLASLAIIWALRQSHTQKHVGIKESYYKSTTPLVPFIIVLLIVGLQVMPLVIGNFLYSAASSAGLTASFVENFAWLGFVFILSIWTFYMLTVSLFALYIVTLPDMTPLRALRSAKELVRYRRWIIMRKLLFLPFVLAVLGVAILLPIIMLFTPAAEIVFLLLNAGGVVVAHSYMYSLYRELL